MPGRRITATWTEACEDLLVFALDQLQALDDPAPLRTERLFSGYAIRYGDTLFAYVAHGSLYFKADDHTRSSYVARGMSPYQPNHKQTIHSLMQVPGDVIDQRDQLAQWAWQAVLAARRSR